MNSKIKKLLNDGINKFNLNNYKESIVSFSEVLKYNQNNFDALSLIAVVYSKIKENQIADSFFLKALALKPNSKIVLNNYGNFLLENGYYTKAKEYFYKLYNLNPDNAQVLANLGKCSYQLNQYDESLNYFKKSLAIEKNNVDTTLTIGIILQRKNFYEDSINYFNKVLKFNEKNYFAWFFKGNSYLYLRNFVEAKKSFLKSIASNIKYKDSYIALYSLYKSERKYDEAIDILEKALNHVEDIESIYVNLSSIYNEKNDQSLIDPFNYAKEYAMKALTINPNNFYALNNLGLSYFKENKNELAISTFQKLIKVKSNFIDGHKNLGVVYNHIGDYINSEKCFRNAINIDPHDNFNYFVLSECQFFQNNFSDGFKNFEYRFKEMEGQPFVTKPNFSLPDWSPDLGYKKILIWGEQGVGDQILFSTIVPELLNLFEKVTLLIDERLCQAYKDSYKNMEILPLNKSINQASYDYQISIGSLGKFFRKSISDFKSLNPLLKVNNQRFSKPSKIRCAFSWKSKGAPKSRLKSLELEMLSQIFEIEDIEFYNIQYSDEKNEIEKINKKLSNKIKYVDGLDTYNDIYGLMQFLDTCDFVFSTSNSNVHFSGALGKTTYLLLPKAIGKMWYWENDFENKNLWYPSITKFYQKEQGDWRDPISELQNSLVGHISKIK